MAVDTMTRRSRRALLAAAAGGFAALATQALARPTVSRANNGDNVIVGQLNDETLETEIENTTADLAALIGHGSGARGIGLQGVTSNGVGVRGDAGTGTGIYGFSGTGMGIRGNSESIAKPAILGDSIGGNTGVQGSSGSGAVPASPDKTGVYGYAGPSTDAGTRGVYGRSAAGRGVYGSTSSGKGVAGYADTGTGVYASAGAGGTAFQATGPVRFSSAGISVIPATSDRVTVPSPVPLTVDSKVLCMLQTSAGGSTGVSRVSRNPAGGTFTIYLTADAAADCKVAWFIIA